MKRVLRFLMPFLAKLHILIFDLLSLLDFTENCSVPPPPLLALAVPRQALF